MFANPPLSDIIDFPNSGAKMCLALVFYAIRAKLTQYRIIFVCDSELSVSHHQIKMYHSDDGLCRESGNPFFASDDILFSRGVFWNGALHWVGRGELALSFDVEQECLHEMPMPPVKEG